MSQGQAQMCADKGRYGDKDGEAEGSGRGGGKPKETVEGGGPQREEQDGGEENGDGVGMEGADGEEDGGNGETDGRGFPKGDRGNPELVQDGRVGCGRGRRRRVVGDGSPLVYSFFFLCS